MGSLGARKSPRSQGQGRAGLGLLQDDHGHPTRSTGTKRRPGAPATCFRPLQGTAPPARLPPLLAWRRHWEKNGDVSLCPCFPPVDPRHLFEAVGSHPHLACEQTWAQRRTVTSPGHSEQASCRCAGPSASWLRLNMRSSEGSPSSSLWLCPEGLGSC